MHVKRLHRSKYAIALVFLLFAWVLSAGAQGLHGYISSGTVYPSTEYTAGIGFHASVWSLVDSPVRGLQIGLPATWITPDNHDNLTEPLCPIGSYARENWPERGPTWQDVFQTMEGGLGYWSGNRFRYGPPKFSMNSTPDCYDSQIASPGWEFFASTPPLPDNRLGIAQLSNRILIPPDGLTFAGTPHGELLGFAYMALPLTDARPDPQPTGNQSWTLFLNAANFRGPVAYFLPETWSRMSNDYGYPFIEGRSLDARRANRGAGGAMEIGSVPIITLNDGGTVYTKIPRLKFPADELGNTILAQDVTYYSKDAIFNDVAAWRAGGAMPSGQFDVAASIKPDVYTAAVDYDQEGEPVTGINELATPTVFAGKVFGLHWSTPTVDGFGYFPQYFVDNGSTRSAVSENVVPESLRTARFPLEPMGPPYHAPLSGAWLNPGPTAGPFTTVLLDGTTLTYYWYRFIDQPVFQQYAWTQVQKDALQSLVVAMHANWTPDKTYIAAPSSGTLVAFDPALLVTPPAGLEAGYVPLVVNQELAVNINTAIDYAIQVKATGRRWCVHDGLGGDGLVQACTTFDVFRLERVDGDSYFRIISLRSGKHLHLDAGGDKLLSTRYQPDDAYTRFAFNVQDSNGFYRISLKANGDFLHCDGSSDNLISTRYQVDDDFTRFALIPADRVFASGFESVPWGT